MLSRLAEEQYSAHVVEVYEMSRRGRSVEHYQIYGFGIDKEDIN